MNISMLILATVVVVALLPAKTQAQPQNDFCEDAISLGVGDNEGGTTSSATIDFDVDECAGTSGVGLGVWYTITGTGRPFLATTCDDDTSFDTQLSVFDGGCGNELSCVAGADDDISCSSSFGQSTVIWETEDGQEYYILVHGFGEENGDFRLIIEELGVENDQCNNAIVLDIGDVISGTTEAAFNNFDIDACQDVSGNGLGVWYVVQGNGRTLGATTCDGDTTYDTQLSVYVGDCDGLFCVGGNDEDFSCNDFSHSTVVWGSEDGVDYYIFVHGFFESTGDFVLSVEEMGHENDQCENAFNIDVREYVDGSTLFDGVDEEASCGDASDSFAPGVWYYIEGQEIPRRLRATTCFDDETTFNTQISVFYGNCGNLRCVDGNDDDEDCSDDFKSTVTWRAELGEEYYILIHGAGEFEMGDFGLEIEVVGPGNDRCNEAFFLGVDSSIEGTTDNAGYDDYVACGDVSGGEDAPGVWYYVEGNGHMLRAHTCERGYDTQLLVLRGDCDELICVDGNDNGNWEYDDEDCGVRSSVVWESAYGTDYYIYVYGKSGDVGNFELVLEDVRPSNDDCSNGRRLSIGESIIDSTELAAVDNFVNDCGSVSNNKGPGLWYVVTGNGRFLRAHTCNTASTLDTQISVFTAANGCSDLSCVGGNNNGCGTRSSFDWESQSGTEYYILVYGVGSNERGEFRLSIEDITLANDVCTGAIGIPLRQQILGSTMFAATESVDVTCPITSATTSTITRLSSLWYVMIGTGQTLVAHACNSGTTFAAQISVFTGSGCDSLTCVGGSNALCPSSNSSMVTWESTLGEVYYVMVHGGDSTGGVSGSGPTKGDFVLTVQEFQPVLAGAVRPAGCGCPCGRRGGMWVKLRNDNTNACVSPDRAFDLMLDNGASCTEGCCKCRRGCEAEKVSVKLTDGIDYCVSEVLANILITEEGVGTCGC